MTIGQMNFILNATKYFIHNVLESLEKCAKTELDSYRDMGCTRENYNRIRAKLYTLQLEIFEWNGKDDDDDYMISGR